MDQYSWAQGLSDPSHLFDLGAPQPQASDPFGYGALGPFAFNFASQPPLPSISSFAFPDFRHHPLAHSHGDSSRNGGNLIEKPAELVSSIPAFNFGAKRQSTQTSSPKPTQQFHQNTPGSPLSQGSSSRSGASGSPSSSLSPTIPQSYGLPPAPIETNSHGQFGFMRQPTFDRPSPFNRSQNHSNRPSSYVSSSSSSFSSSRSSISNDHRALDILAVAAQSSRPPPPPTPAPKSEPPFASLPLEELQRQHQEQQQKITTGLKREREQEEVPETSQKKKKRIGRALDPERTRMLIFPPTLPPRSFTPTESAQAEGYVKRSVPEENLYAARWTKGNDSRTRVAFCEYCGELDLPTRMSGYGYHLLHTHNLSSHSPYIMPSPRRVRTVPTPRCPATILGREEACLKASPSLEGQCPFTGEGREGIGKCALGGWHKLNGFREAMNAHLGGKGLDSS